MRTIKANGWATVRVWAMYRDCQPRVRTIRARITGKRVVGAHDLDVYDRKTGECLAKSTGYASGYHRELVSYWFEVGDTVLVRL